MAENTTRDLLGTLLASASLLVGAQGDVRPLTLPLGPDEKRR